MGMFIARFMRPVWGQKEFCGKRIWFVVSGINSLLSTSEFLNRGKTLAVIYAT